MNDRYVEILVLEGCPNTDATLIRTRAAIDATNVRAQVHLVRVVSEDDAKRLHFLGSPTVRVDGVDIDASATQRGDYALQCRVYSVDGRLEGLPPVASIAAALLD